MVESITKDIRELKKYALDNKVPIMLDESMDFMIDFITRNNLNKVLEIGSGIGYSSIMMALANPNLKIVTIEKDEARYLEAIKNIKKFDLENRITLIYKDALETKIEDKFDLLFIDAAKAKNKDFFNRFEKNITEGKYIITDNISFHGYVDKDDNEIESKDLRNLVIKIKDYINFLEEHDQYTTRFYKIGDGLSISQKK
ncbi:MAG: O-methyltransferase [Tenericutes bacterium]|nr:O-methyltransferase [Mycoplasmatota bacterium]